MLIYLLSDKIIMSLELGLILIPLVSSFLWAYFSVNTKEVFTKVLYRFLSVSSLMIACVIGLTLVNCLECNVESQTILPWEYNNDISTMLWLIFGFGMTLLILIIWLNLLWGLIHFILVKLGVEKEKNNFTE